MSKALSCFLLLFLLSQSLRSQNFEWVQQIDETEHWHEFIVFDSSGNFYSAGNFQGKKDFDPGSGVFYMESSPTNKPDMYIRKFNSDGRFLWAKQFKGIGSDDLNDLEIDQYGNLYATGYFTETVDFDPDTSVYNVKVNGNKTYSDIFCLKLDSSGAFIWVVNMGNGKGDHGKQITTDPNGNVYVMGEYTGRCDFDPDTGTYWLTSDYQQYDIFVLCLNPQGKFKWAISYYAWSIEEGVDLVADSNQNCYILGYFRSHIDLDPGPLQKAAKSKGYDDVFVVCLDSLGKYKWHRSFGGDSSVLARKIMLNDQHQLMIYGLSTDTVDFDPSSKIHHVYLKTPLADMFNLHLNDTGGFISAYDVDHTDGHSQYYTTPEYVANGYSYKEGSFFDTEDFDPGLGVFQMTSAGERDIFLQKLSPKGNLVWVFRLGSGNHEEAWETFIDRDQNIFIEGHFYDTIDFDPGPKTYLLGRVTPRYSDTYLLKLSQDSCSDLTVFIDSLVDNSCSQNSYVSVAIETGNAPYHYQWSSAKNDTLPFIKNKEQGYYYVTVTDALGCSRNRRVQITGRINPPTVDLNAHLVTNNFEAGQSTQIMIDANNWGCTKSNGSVEIILSPALNYNSASITPDSIIGRRLVWLFNGLNRDSEHFRCGIDVTTDAKSSLNDSIVIQLNIKPLKGDVNLKNNSKEYLFRVENDQKDIEMHVFPHGSCKAGFLDSSETLTYSIYFQNNGVSPIKEISVWDSLSPLLDRKSIEFVGSSSPFKLDVSDEDQMVWRINHLNIPNSKTNLFGSVGYVIFSAKLKKSIPDNSVVENKAYLRFDQRPRFETRTVESTITHKIDLSKVYVNLGADTGFCTNTSLNIQLDAGSKASSYSWQDGSSKQFFNATQKGTYWVKVEDDQGCKGFDEIVVSEYPLPYIHLGNDTSFCDDGKLHVFIEANFASEYHWSTGLTDRTILINSAGDYQCTISDIQGCSNSDDIMFTALPVPEIELGEDLIYCENEVFQRRLSAGPGHSLYEWNTGTTDSFLLVKTPGNYSVEVWNSMGCTGKDTIEIREILGPEINLGPDSSYCKGEAFHLILTTSNPLKSYLWSNGSTASQIQIDTAGVYWLYGQNALKCSNTDSIVISTKSLPTVQLGEDILWNPDLAVDTLLKAGGGHAKYLWSDGSSDTSLRIVSTGNYWLKVSNDSGCSASDTVALRYWNTSSSGGLAFEELKIFPNPARNYLRIEYSGEIENAKILDLSGRLVKTISEISDGSISIKELSEGIYLIQIQSASGHSFVSKFAVLKN
jgi:hypothetical protein